MSRMGVYLYSRSTAVTNRMFQEGFLHNQGLVKDNKGKINPILPEDRPSRAELGIFRRDH